MLASSQAVAAGSIDCTSAPSTARRDGRRAAAGCFDGPDENVLPGLQTSKPITSDSLHRPTTRPMKDKAADHDEPPDDDVAR